MEKNHEVFSHSHAYNRFFLLNITVGKRIFCVNRSEFFHRLEKKPIKMTKNTLSTSKNSLHLMIFMIIFTIIHCISRKKVETTNFSML